MRVRSTLLLAAAAASALVLTACGGGEKKDAAEPSAPATTLAPLPQVDTAQVKPLVGRWIGTAKDYFEFKADGTGVWMRSGQKLWSGTAIPEGGGKFRFSWQGGDPQGANYWGVALTDGNAKLLFNGTNQKYTRMKAKARS
ncbi:hypothetical protein [Spirillospora albida]|uniref:hypothetical protein n=1 Tax=Spirillospora albida TaxID=58123 RepID=UPI0004BF709D|nr:hypothetical protein [Spirillospora albida]